MGDPGPTPKTTGVNGTPSGLAKKADDNAKLPYDSVLVSIMSYVYEYEIQSPRAILNAKTALIDALGCALESLHESRECAAMIGPVSPDIQIQTGFKLPGTKFQMEPLKGAFDLGAMIRYLDHNDAYPGAEWGHPSDNIGAILAVADWQSRLLANTTPDQSRSGPPLTMGTVLSALIKAYEIQGCFQIRNAFNKVGLDHTILVKISSTAVVSWMLGLSKDQALSALSHAWMDGHPLRVYRQSPNAGPRKGWAAGDACMRAVHLALLAKSGQPGAPSVLTTPRWGFYEVLFKGNEFDLPRPFTTWTIENIVFKVFTAEGHALSAVEAALTIAELLKNTGKTVDDIDRIQVRTQEAAMIIINKQGPLHNPADRDHCMQYMVATVILKGAMIETADYQDESPWARDIRVEQLRERIHMSEDPQLTKDYHDAEKRSCTNALTVTFKDGTTLPEVMVEWPLGSSHRGDDTLRAVQGKARRNLGLGLPADNVDEILRLVSSQNFETTPVRDFVDLFVP